MARITDIEEQKKQEGRVSIFLDGDFWVGMPYDLAVMLKLKPELEIDDEQKAEIEKEVAKRVAVERAVHLLSYRARSEQELRQRLAEKDFNEAIIGYTIEQLDEWGMINDTEFAEQVIEGEKSKGKGRRAVSYALRQKGVPSDIATEVLDSEYPDELEADIALAWASRKRNVEPQKLQRQLATRGFSYDVISQVIAQLVEDMEEDPRF